MTSENEDIRWEQRFANYRKALRKLTTAVEFVLDERTKGRALPDMDDLRLEGLIHRFENTHELAWNVTSPPHQCATDCQKLVFT